MHYECELAVVIGKECRNVKRDQAYEYVRGYTVANDYAISDYLENYYRPNMRVKGRDACTPIGQIGRAACRESECQYVQISVVGVPLKNKSGTRVSVTI